MPEIEIKGEKNRMDQKRNITKRGKSRAGRLCLTFILSLLLGGCGGCTLARPELQQTKEDRLCGILVTVGEQEALRHNEKELEGMTFSSIRELEESLISSVQAEGIRQPDGTYVFEGVEGHMLGIKKEPEEDGVPYVHFINDGSFTEVKANTTATDEGRKDSISGVILAGENVNEPIYIHPVYSREDGSCYAILSSHGGFLIGGVKTEGEVYGQTFQWETSEEINGKKETNSIEIQVSLKMAYPVERVYVRMYDDKDEFLGEQEIQKEMDEFLLQKETAYVIVEEKISDGRIKRSLYNWEEGQEAITHQVNYPGEDGLLASADLVLKK